ncbi:AAA family ATPase [Streptomyces yaizuensis]|uniref:AAA family ATPase n=1 Tax=Streptomyces yaizuensis TaxID=2989713 RepID=A0ABQ5NZR6_9ACTN|nr:AAA family ATPase [Streptomyces sp. YSPA8]GLF95852.1 AAA family ATPase [Streptomyces sp. YSPA8]
MTWQTYYRGDGLPRDVELADPPPWRTFPRRSAHEAFQPPEGLTDAVNAALYLRRPLLITGAAGTGKSTVVEQVAAELRLGSVLRWHITSRSTLADALCRYDALGHIHALRLRQTVQPATEPATEKGTEPATETATGADDIAPFLRLGPLGTALLPGTRPRALLIDEIDKSDLDLPSDLLDVLERGEFEIPELVRHPGELIPVRTADTDARRTHDIADGHVQCTEFPFIVMTSNGERDFAPPFLRRCVRYEMPAPTADTLRRAVAAHLGAELPGQGPVAGLIESFAARVERGDSLAVDQLLNAVRLLTDAGAPTGEQRERLLALLTRELNGG